MATPRETRRLAFQLLFQMDAQGAADEAALRAWITQADLGSTFSPAETDRALATALAAFAHRAAADAEFDHLAPAWPARRQAAADRAILRLAHFEIAGPSSHDRPAAPPKAVINDAIDLAREFSTDRSPAFINGLLDKVYRRVTAETPAPPDAAAAPGPADPVNPPDPSAPA